MKIPYVCKVDDSYINKECGHVNNKGLFLLGTQRWWLVGWTWTLPRRWPILVWSTICWSWEADHGWLWAIEGPRCAQLASEALVWPFEFGIVQNYVPKQSGGRRWWQQKVHSIIMTKSQLVITKHGFHGYGVLLSTVVKSLGTKMAISSSLQPPLNVFFAHIFVSCNYFFFFELFVWVQCWPKVSSRWLYLDMGKLLHVYEVRPWLVVSLQRAFIFAYECVSMLKCNGP